MAGGVPVTRLPRLEAFRRAHELIDELEQRSQQTGLGLLPALGASCFELMRASLAVGLVERFQDGSTPASPAPLDSLRTRAYLAREKWRRRPQKEPLAGEPVEVLAVAGNWTHRRDLEPVTTALERDHGLSTRWLARRADFAPPGVRVWAFAQARESARSRVRLLTEIGLLCARLEQPPWVRRGVRWHAELSLGDLLRARRLIEALDAPSVGLVMIGNTVTLEGRTLAFWARAHGKPIMTIQHGTLVADDPAWARALADRFCAWGTDGRDTLLAMGHDPASVIITGAPHRHRPTVAKDHPRKTVLVALSGAGHMVSHHEHHAQVAALFAAAEALAPMPFLFRIHPKDDVALYLRAAERHPGAEVTISRSKERGPIAEDLAEARVLVTVTSTSALDAMDLGVPVVSFGRPLVEMPGHVRGGGTVHVADDEELGAAIEGVCERGLPDAVREAAAHTARAFYGEPDGRAVERVAAVALELLGPKRPPDHAGALR